MPWWDCNTYTSILKLYYHKNYKWIIITSSCIKSIVSLTVVGQLPETIVIQNVPNQKTIMNQQRILFNKQHKHKMSFGLIGMITLTQNVFYKCSFCIHYMLKRNEQKVLMFVRVSLCYIKMEKQKFHYS